MFSVYNTLYFEIFNEPLDVELHVFSRLARAAKPTRFWVVVCCIVDRGNLLWRSYTDRNTITSRVSLLRAPLTHFAAVTALTSSAPPV